MDMRPPAALTATTTRPSAAMRAEDRLDMPTERLPFTVRRVESEDSLNKAVRIRHAAYARHLPDFARTLAMPEACDYADDTIVLLAESKLDGSPLGTARIQTNQNGALHLEESIELPDWLQGRRLAEVTRLGVDEGRIGRVVKIALIKAAFEFCEQNGIDHAVVTGRAPIDRQYEQLLFRDVFADKAMVPLHHVGNIPHRVMAFEIATGEERWTEARHPMLAFFRHTRHPDIDVTPGVAVQAMSWNAQRSAAANTVYQRQFATL
jgi:GNAT superfamily N-acetyltransferase